VVIHATLAVQVRLKLYKHSGGLNCRIAVDFYFSLDTDLEELKDSRERQRSTDSANFLGTVYRS
jgi:hypothetical protein